MVSVLFQSICSNIIFYLIYFLMLDHQLTQVCGYKKKLLSESTTENEAQLDYIQTQEVLFAASMKDLKHS